MERLDCLGYRFFRNILLLLIILKNLKFFFRNQPSRTGNWGCGGFGGNRELKIQAVNNLKRNIVWFKKNVDNFCIDRLFSLLQITGAQRSGRKVVYMTYDDEDFKNNCRALFEKLQTTSVTISLVCKLISEYYGLTTKRASFFEFVKENI